MKYTPRQTESNVNVTPTSPIREFFVLMGGLLGIVILIYILLGLAVNLIVPHISVDLEKKMAAPFIRSMYAQDADTIRQHYVQALIDDLQERCTTLPYHFQVHVRKHQPSTRWHYRAGILSYSPGSWTRSHPKTNWLLFLPMRWAIMPIGIISEVWVGPSCS